MNLKALGFEHNGKYIDANNIYPKYEYYLPDICEVSMSATKRIKENEAEPMEFPMMEMVMFFPRIFSKNDQDVTFYKYINTQTDSKESIQEIIEKVKKRYKTEQY